MKKRVFISVLLTAGAMVGTYKLWHHAPVLIFISILILSFLLSYKITDYIADFKTVKHNSRADIAFLLIFFVLLCIPASHITKAKKAKGENRYLAPKAALINHKKLNLDYGKEFNEWFNDRFNLRKQFISLNINLACSINRNYCGNAAGIVWYKKSNFVIRKSVPTFQKNKEEKYISAKKFKENKQEILDTYADNVNKLQAYCDKNNIKLYILLVPIRNKFYKYPFVVQQNSGPDQAEEVIEYLKANTKTNVIYPKEAMNEAHKQTPVYFKTDGHWTKKGAYVGYCELMKQIKKDFPAVNILQESSLEKYYDNRVQSLWNNELGLGRDLDQMNLSKNINKKILDTPYLYYKNPNSEKLQTTVKFAPIPEIGYAGSKHDNQFYYPSGLDEKLVAITNSFGGNLMEFLPYSFKYTVRYYDNFRHMKFDVYKDTLEQYKPNILVINIETVYLPNLLNLYPNKFSKKEPQ